MRSTMKTRTFVLTPSRRINESPGNHTQDFPASWHGQTEPILTSQTGIGTSCTRKNALEDSIIPRTSLLLEYSDGI